MGLWPLARLTFFVGDAGERGLRAGDDITQTVA